MSKAVWEKLQLDPGKKVLLMNEPGNYFDRQPERTETQADFVHLFTNSILEYSTLLQHAKKAIRQNGTIWISHYKKASKRPSELDSNIVREMASDAGLVDNKICSIDSEWTACRVVIPLRDRH